jgi:hypothetical protein
LKLVDVGFTNINQHQLTLTNINHQPTSSYGAQHQHQPTTSDRGLIQDGWLQFHVARLVHAMHVAEGCGHGEEAVGDFAQGVIDLEDLLPRNPQRSATYIGRQLE